MKRSRIDPRKEGSLLLLLPLIDQIAIKFSLPTLSLAPERELASQEPPAKKEDR